MLLIGVSSPRQGWSNLQSGLFRASICILSQTAELLLRPHLIHSHHPYFCGLHLLALNHNLQEKLWLAWQPHLYLPQTEWPVMLVIIHSARGKYVLWGEAKSMDQLFKLSVGHRLCTHQHRHVLHDTCTPCLNYCRGRAKWDTNSRLYLTPFQLLIQM